LLNENAYSQCFFCIKASGSTHSLGAGEVESAPCLCIKKVKHYFMLLFHVLIILCEQKNCFSRVLNL
jgi:hypothetical protein